MTPPTPLPFYSFRRNMQLWKATLDNAPNFPSLDDQTVFWTTVRQSTQVPLSTPCLSPYLSPYLAPYIVSI